MTLCDECRFDSVKHLVEGALEFGEVVVAGDLDSAAEIAAPNCMRSFAEPAHRSEQPARHERSHAGDDQPGQGRDHRIGAQQLVDLHVCCGQVVHHHEGGITVYIVDGLCSKPIATAANINFGRTSFAPHRVDRLDEDAGILEFLVPCALQEGLARCRKAIQDLSRSREVALKKQLEKTVCIAEGFAGVGVGPGLLQCAELRDLLGLFAIDGAVKILSLDHVKREAYSDQSDRGEQCDNRRNPEAN